MDQQSAALLERAAAFRQAGRVEEAIVAYERLLEREPDLPESWYNLGWLQRQARHYEEALDSYAEALARGVSGPEEVRLNRAVILSDHLARPDEAKAELEAALRAKPDYLPALLNLGNLQEDLGERDAAEATYRLARQTAPGNALVLARLAGVSDGRSETAAELIETIRTMLDSAADAAERADLGFALGRLLDARKNYREAFAVYEAANSASRESFGVSFTDYDRAAHEHFVDRMIAAFPEPAATQVGGESPIFIAGMFRSGSTLVERILAGHSQIQAGGELDLIPTLVARIPDYPEAVPSADERTISAWRQFYLEDARRLAREALLLTDKRPDNFLHIGLIKTLFPDAKIVHTRRERLDNLLSLYFLHLGPRMPYALDLRDAAHWYAQYERLMEHWKRLYPDDIFDVSYDALVRAPRTVVQPLLSFLALGCEEAVLDFHRREGVVKTASVWQVREPLHARSSGRWRNYSAQISELLGSDSEARSD